MKKLSTREMTVCAILTAMYVVLQRFAALNFGEYIKISFAPFPVIVAGLLLGPLSGLTVGALGEGIIQVATYGLTATTLLWIMPVGLRGLLCGLYAKKNGFSMTNTQIILCVLVTGLVVTLLNTGVLYLDSRIYHYPVTLTALAIFMRFVSSVLMTAAYCVLLPKSLSLLKNALRR